VNQSKLRLLFFVPVLLLMMALPALAQQGTIVGTITDPSGLPAPNVAITITDVGTGLPHRYTTGTTGEFVAADLPIGTYDLRAQATGFKVAEQKGIVLNVGDRDRIDVKLEVGSTQETVNVEANVVAVQTDSGEVSDLITGKQMQQLATNGRSFYSLATLTAGASSNMSDFNVPTPVGGNATVSFNGQRQSHNLYMIDGGEDYDRGGSGNISIMPSMDSIAEFRMLTSNYGAEYGLSSAGTMTMAFKSGTRDFHGTAWEFLRNNALDAGYYFNNASNQPSPELRFNVFGFNIGGPVFIPKVYNKDKNKTFFFYNMEWRKLVQGGNVNQTVPLASEYGGQFNSTIYVPSASQLAPSILAKYTAQGLVPGQPFPNNKIPAALLDPNAQVLLQAGIFPAPNNGGTQFVGGSRQPTDVREEIIRIDQQFTDRFQMFGHWVSESISQTYGTSLWSGDNVPTVGTLFGNPSYSGVLHATYSVSPTLVNEAAFNYNGNRISITPTGTYVQPAALNIPQLFSSNALDRMPAIQLAGSTGTNYTTASWPWANQANDYQVRDDVSWTKGAHQFKFGGSWAYYGKHQQLFGTSQGAFQFNGLYTKNDFADFLLGLSNNYQELAVQDFGQWNNISWAAYAQDTWRVNSRLTLNLGLRWDGIPHTYEASNRMSNFYPNLYNPAEPAIIQAGGNSISPNSPGLGTSPNPALNGVLFYLNGIGIAGQNGIPKGLVQNHWATFGPRVGFAYDVTGKGKTIIRGGIGLMYERIQGNDMYNAGPNEPFSTVANLNSVSLSNPNQSLSTGQTVTLPITVGQITGLAYTDYKPPTSWQYSFGVQQELWTNTVLSVAYVGNVGHHQNDYRDTNLPAESNLATLIQHPSLYNQLVQYSGFNSITLAENAENMHYNSLQVNLHAQAGKDLQVQFAYTLSKSIDPATGGGGSGDLSTVSNPYNRAYDIGPSGLDRTNVALVNFIYSIPLFNNSTNRALKTALGGWDFSGIITMESGLPIWMTLGGSQGSNGTANGTNRPNVNGSVSYPQTVGQWFNPAAFSVPALGEWGNLGKNAVRGPGRDNWNMSLFKSFVFNERGTALQFRAEFFNVWNHTQFNNVSSSYSASNFGQVTSTWDPRTLQFGLKFMF
jgi:Carboxypeptidase regulatory-like domain